MGTKIPVLLFHQFCIAQYALANTTLYDIIYLTLYMLNL